jgi:hypothetical protein
VVLEPEPRSSRLHTGLTIKTLLNDPDGRVVVTKFIGGFLLMADMSMAADMTLEQVSANHPNFVPREMLAQIETELQRIK